MEHSSFFQHQGSGALSRPPPSRSLFAASDDSPMEDDTEQDQGHSIFLPPPPAPLPRQHRSSHPLPSSGPLACPPSPFNFGAPAPDNPFAAFSPLPPSTFAAVREAQTPGPPSARPQTRSEPLPPARPADPDLMRRGARRALVFQGQAGGRGMTTSFPAPSPRRDSTQAARALFLNGSEEPEDLEGSGHGLPPLPPRPASFEQAPGPAWARRYSTDGPPPPGPAAAFAALRGGPGPRAHPHPAGFPAPFFSSPPVLEEEEERPAPSDPFQSPPRDRIITVTAPPNIHESYRASKSCSLLGVREMGALNSVDSGSGLSSDSNAGGGQIQNFRF